MRYFLLLGGNQNSLVMGKFINPFTDFGFHRIFGQEVHKELLIDFLNELLKDERHIVDITFLNPIQQPETIEDRGVIFDIHCRDDKGGLFVVEMQNGAQPYFYDRGIYYLSRAISNWNCPGLQKNRMIVKQILNVGYIY